MGEEFCNVGKVLDKKCNLVYSRNVGGQQIGSLSQDRDLLTSGTKCFIRYLYSPWKEIYR